MARALEQNYTIHLGINSACLEMHKLLHRRWEGLDRKQLSGAEVSPLLWMLKVLSSNPPLALAEAVTG